MWNANYSQDATTLETTANGVDWNNILSTNSTEENNNTNTNSEDGGLAFLDQWGSLRYSSTASFMALLYAQGLENTQQKNDYISFAKTQMNYILGDNPRNSSYVVGYGSNLS